MDGCCNKALLSSRMTFLAAYGRTELKAYHWMVHQLTSKANKHLFLEQGRKDDQRIATLPAKRTNYCLRQIIHSRIMFLRVLILIIDDGCRPAWQALTGRPNLQ